MPAVREALLAAIRARHARTTTDPVLTLLLALLQLQTNLRLAAAATLTAAFTLIPIALQQLDHRNTRRRILAARARALDIDIARIAVQLNRTIIAATVTVPLLHATAGTTTNPRMMHLTPAMPRPCISRILPTRRAARTPHVRAGPPKGAAEQRAQHGQLDGDDADDGLADTPAVDVEGRGGLAEGEGGARDGGADDEDARRQQRRDGELAGRGDFQTPQHGDGDDQDGGVGDDVERDGDEEVLGFEGAFGGRQDGRDAVVVLEAVGRGLLG